MTQLEQQKQAKKFSEDWKDKGYEKGESQKFWLDLLSNVFGIKDLNSFISFEDQVHLDHTSFIDGYIPSTKVMIEQKSLGKDLRTPIKQSDGTFLTPFQQAKRYITELPVSKHPRWVITSNFSSFLVYDMERPNGEPEEILLENLETEFYRLSFIADTGSIHLKREMELSIKAGDIVGLLYDKLLKQYKNPDSEKTLKSLNMLCVRLVFCLYAEDAGIFGHKSMFHDYMESYNTENMRDGLLKLFKILDTKIEDRDAEEKESLLAFPYVNGGLFTEEDLSIPQFNDDIRELLLQKASADFNWSQISPTIFGAVFESTLNPETRRSGGMHYTSIENIHKVIDPLFLNDLNAEFEEIKAIKTENARREKLIKFQAKLGELKFLDPACGSGNFLTETYLSLRRLENKCLQVMIGGNEQQGVLTNLFGYDLIRVHIQQMYGIEINDFACVVAKTALWIAECQMLQETNAITGSMMDFLPLDNYTNITEGNALKIDWSSVIPTRELSFIMGNPPFVGQAMRTKEQAQEMQEVFAPSTAGGKLDYVAGWFKKASDLMRNTDIQTAFVSSNSICQGESVNLLWEELLQNNYINFAHTTFKWTSESNDSAAVMCVVVGFSNKERKEKILFSDGIVKKVSHINGYLTPAPDIFIKNRSKSINAGVAQVVQGSPPADDGKLLLTPDERKFFISKYPELEKVIKPFVGSREFINDTEYTRYCFWFVGTKPSEYQHIKELQERLEYIRDFRLKSPVDRIQKTADKPYLFTQNRQPTTDFLIIPRVSSSTRKYIPIGFLSPDVIVSDSAVLVYDASLYDFGILCSNVHNAWMRLIAGRLKNDYRYAPSVYYNFPLPSPSEECKSKIINTASQILEARKLYPTKTLADMYGDKMYLYPELLEAHRQNDRAVMAAYGWTTKTVSSETECLAELFKLYEELSKKLDK